jgi:hypothetical protein
MPVWAFERNAVRIDIASGRSDSAGSDADRDHNHAQALRPDMLLTDDGQHLAIMATNNWRCWGRGPGNMRSMLRNGSNREEAMALDDMPGAVLSGCAFCKGGRQWRILALRSGYDPSMELAAAVGSDIVTGSRWLPRL